MIKLFWSGLLTVLLLSGCGWDGTATRPNDFATLTSIQIVPASTTIAAGTSTKLTVIGSYSGQFTRDVTDQATWSSDNTAVAGFITASSPNRVTGVAPGSAILKATVGGLSATSTPDRLQCDDPDRDGYPVRPDHRQGLEHPAFRQRHLLGCNDPGPDL